MSILILSGKNEAPYLGDGWYGLERSPEGILYRAAKPKAFLTLPVEGKTELTLYCSARPEHTNTPFECFFLVDGDKRAEIALNSNNWVTRMVELTLTKDSTIEIHTKTPWSPDTLYQNGDIRALGMLVSSIRVNDIEMWSLKMWYNLVKMKNNRRN